MESLALARPEVTTSLDPAAWDRFVEEHPEASGYHLSAWRSIFEDVFGHRTLNLSAVREGRVAGILPLVEFRSRLFGRFAVSLPFVNQGGVVADDDEVARTLLARAVDEARSRGLGHIELRHEKRWFPDLADKQHKVSMRLRLPDTGDALWNQLDRKVRNQIRKAEKNGLAASSGGAELVDAFYAVFTENMRDLGTPVYSRGFFSSIVQRFPERTRIHVVRLGSEVVASSLTFAWRDTVEVPWASSLRKHRDKSPNNLLYWAMLQQAIAGWAARLRLRPLDAGRGDLPLQVAVGRTARTDALGVLAGFWNHARSKPGKPEISGGHCRMAPPAPVCDQPRWSPAGTKHSMTVSAT
jgi:FemAB-related protein (PEP-CTERM system-associated)